MLRYAITARALYPGDEDEKQAALLRQASCWAADGIDFIQLREKDLPTSTLGRLAREILETIALTTSSTRLLINSRPDVAIATGAHGVHLTSAPSEITPTQIRSLYASANVPTPVITVSCHTLDDVERARQDQVNLILFAPVFEKMIADHATAPGQGLDRLRAACIAASPIPVCALGGVTFENATSCVEAGAAGIAGIRLFHNS
jgi:thiamine-phosphate pyrophosphorylase